MDSKASQLAVDTVKAAGGTDPGLQREVNEDRFHVDPARGLFMVIDGVGGQAAGGKAADTAVIMLRARLERETGPIASRLREAIAAANNEIHRLAGLRSEWTGMACVLTAAVLRDGSATIGHVGDTRLYKLWRGRIEKITRDHSPVGEREDAHELSELDAMQHPRRNEVYRDVGSERHEPGDPDFIDVQEIPFEPDAALLLCSDGLTDLVDSSSIKEIVQRRAGRPQEVVDALIDAANTAGGKDNVTVVYVEGERFPAARLEEPAAETEITRRLATTDTRATRRQRIVRMSNIMLIAAVILLTFVGSDPVAPLSPPPLTGSPVTTDASRIVVHPAQSIAEALNRAQPGTTIVVEPGEYRETLLLKSNVRLTSRVPGEAIIRLPGTASERAAAVVAKGVSAAVLEGFRIVGDAATPLGTGISSVDSELSLIEVEITGARGVAVDIGRGSSVRVVAAEIHDNPGLALAVRSGARAAVSHSVFARNAAAAGPQALLVEPQSAAELDANVFVGSTANIFNGPPQARPAFARGNWFIEARPPGAQRSGRGR